MTATVSSAGTIVRRPSRSAARLVAAGTTTATAFATGAILELTNLQWHANLVQTAAQRVTMIAFIVGLIASAPLLAALGRASGRVGRWAAWAAIAAQLTIAALTVDSVIQGNDASFFNPVAGLANGIWLLAVGTLATSLFRRRSVPRPLAVGVAIAYVCTIPLAHAGGGLLAAGYWLAVAVYLARTATAEQVRAEAGDSVQRSV
jgi:hypothetical protein